MPKKNALATTYFPTALHDSIISADLFHDLVRDGKGWFQAASITRTIDIIKDLLHISKGYYNRGMDELVSSHKLFHSFCIKPDTRFDTQRANEEVILVLRAHPITLLPAFMNGFIFFIILFFLNFFIPSFLSVSQILFVNIFGLVVILNYLWLAFLNWYFNIGIITNQGIVDIDFNLILYKETTYTLLSHVEDVTSKSGGFFESLFNYGNLFIQTAGTEVNTEFLNIPHPSAAAKIINSLVHSESTNG